MNIEKLTEYVTILNALPDEIKNNKVYMGSLQEPNCYTPGCHSGLVSIAAAQLPELRECYNKICKMECEYISAFPKDYIDYSYRYWADALSLYLGFPYNEDIYTYHGLTKWARENPYMWDNIYGDGMFISGIAFGQDTDIFPHSVIIDHFTEMSDRLNKN